MNIGTVTYPDDTHWEVTITGVAGNFSFTVTDGTDTLFETGFIQDVILQITLIEPIYGGYRIHGVIEPGRELIIAP